MVKTFPAQLHQYRKNGDLKMLFMIKKTLHESLYTMTTPKIMKNDDVRKKVPIRYFK